MTRLVASRWFLPIVVLGFSIIGLALGMSGDPSVQAVGWTCVLFFGVGTGSVLVAQALTPPAPAAVSGAATLPDGSVVPAVILGYRRLNPVLRAISILGATAGAVAFALAPRPEAGLDSFGARAIVGLGAAYFAVVLVIRLLGSTKGADTLTFAAAGLTLSWAGATTYIPWASCRLRCPLGPVRRPAALTFSSRSLVRSFGVEARVLRPPWAHSSPDVTGSRSRCAASGSLPMKSPPWLRDSWTSVERGDRLRSPTARPSGPPKPVPACCMMA